MKLINKDKLSEKIDMYDMIIANLIANNSIIEPSKQLDNDQIAIGFSNISSETQISKYFVIKSFPDFLKPNLIGIIRDRCVDVGIKVNFYTYASPYKINWNSSEMKNKLSIWRRYTADNNGSASVFDYRDKRDSQLTRRRIIYSTKFLNESELDNKRSLYKASFLIELTAKRDEESLLNLSNSIRQLKGLCAEMDIKIRELRVNMLDWMRVLNPFSLTNIREVVSKIPKKILTDDILANFNTYRQGRVGYSGIPIGIDVLNGSPVLYHPKEDKDAAENWLIIGETASGKSVFVKNILNYLLAFNIVVTVMDYEGDEYTNIANYLRASDPEFAKIISMGKGSTEYFDPMEIAFTTGVSDIDNEMMENALSSTLAIFRTIICGVSGDLSTIQEKIISSAIRRVYESAGVTTDQSTWDRSIGLRLLDVYKEIKEMIDAKELVDYDNDNIKHKEACSIVDACSIYFEDGESKCGTFKNPLSVNELLHSSLIVFSFGMKGAANTGADRVTLALKQISVANVGAQIANYCKYVLGKFNAKIWEEYNRWGELEGSAGIIGNEITGARKRGTINFIITNDAAALLDSNNKINRKICLNIQHKVIGKINNAVVRRQVCELLGIEHMEDALEIIAKSNSTTTRINNRKVKMSSGYGSRYKFAFCTVFGNGNESIVKAAVPLSLANSALFSAGATKEMHKER